MILSGRASVILIAVLVISVSLNLFGAGLIAGEVFQRRGAPMPPPDGVAPIAEGFVRATLDVPPEVRSYLRTHVERRTGAMMGELRGLRQSRRAVAQALAGEPFDRQALEAAFVQVRATTDRTQAVLHDALADAIEAMPVEARRRWAESWQNREVRLPRGDGPSPRSRPEPPPRP